MPLFYEEEIIGVLELLDREGAPSYSAGDIATLGLFANQAAVAIEQSRNQQSLGALLGGVIQTLGGLSDHRACRTILEGFAGYLRSRPRADEEVGEEW